MKYNDLKKIKNLYFTYQDIAKSKMIFTLAFLKKTIYLLPPLKKPLSIPFI